MTDDLVKQWDDFMESDRHFIEGILLGSQMRARIEALTTQLAEHADVRKQIDHRLEELVGQVDALTAERDQLYERWNDCQEKRMVAEADNARLLKALKPFADEAGHWDFYTADEPLVEGFPTYEGNITVGDLRDARAALTGKETK